MKAWLAHRLVKVPWMACWLSFVMCSGAVAEINPWFSPGFYSAKPAYLAQIELTVEQEDSLFKLLHAQLPAIRELQAERMSAEHAVQEQALINNYDREVVEPMVERLAKALVAEHIQRAEIDNRIVSLLTPAQREQVVSWWQQQVEAVGRRTEGAPEQDSDKPKTKSE